MSFLKCLGMVWLGIIALLIFIIILHTVIYYLSGWALAILFTVVFSLAVAWGIYQEVN